MSAAARSLVVVSALLAAVAIGACGGGGSEERSGPRTPTSEPTPDTLPSSPTVDDLARIAGCEGITPFADEPPVGPIRGGAASAGASCTIDGIEAHLFVRASTEPPPGAVAFIGGTLENIDRLVATGAEGPCAAWVAVGETWFALVADREVLENVAEALGGGVREVLPTGPPASYLPPGCGP